MRLKKREITEFSQIIELLEECQVLRVAFYDEDYPYVVPMSYGFEAVDGKITIYFHCSKDGKKPKLIEKNNKVCVECDVLKGYMVTPYGATADYKSFIGLGKIEKIFEQEALKGLNLIVKHCNIDGFTLENCKLMPFTDVYKIVIEEFSGKKRF